MYTYIGKHSRLYSEFRFLSHPLLKNKENSKKEKNERAISINEDYIYIC